jgi:phosphohistidine phosphatase
MKRLYLLRHAKSSWADMESSDFDRPLSTRGREACSALRTSLKRRGAAPERVLCSAARRTRETLERIAPALPAPHTTTIERALYLANAGKLLERLNRLEDEYASALVIGHNPGLQELARLLIGSGPRRERARIEVKFPTGGLAALSFEGEGWRDLAPGLCALASFWCPRDARD